MGALWYLMRREVEMSVTLAYWAYGLILCGVVLVLLATLLRNAGLDVRVIDATARQMSVEEVIAALDHESFAPTLDDADLAVRVVDHVSTVTSSVSTAEAKVVVSGGRGVARPAALSIPA